MRLSIRLMLGLSIGLLLVPAALHLGNNPLLLGSVVSWSLRLLSVPAGLFALYVLCECWALALADLRKLRAELSAIEE